MALLWETRRDGNHYEVRSAGRTRRLYTNGICHSDYNPTHAVTRSVWDCLFLPVLFRPPAGTRRVLVLGVGGGSVIHLLQRYIEPEHIVGVELSAVHLDVAENYFELQAAELHEAEAGTWLHDYAGPPFDFIIDDLFLEEGNEARRAIDVDAGWMRVLLKHLTPGGILSINFPDRRTLGKCAWFTHGDIRRRLPAGFSLRTPFLDNVVGAFCRFQVERKTLNKQLAAIPALARAQKNGQLRYSVRQLKQS